MKSKGRFYKAKNPHNQFIFEYLNNQKMICISQGRDKLVFGYQKLLMSLQRYPVPILTEEQASSLQGVGQKTACMIVKLINQAYKDDQNLAIQVNEAILDDADGEEEVQERGVTSSCPTQFPLNTQVDDMIKQPLNFDTFKPQKRKENFLNGLNFKLQQDVILSDYKQVKQTDDTKPQVFSSTNQIPSKIKNYLPNKQSKGWGIMMSLHRFEVQEDRCFATRKEIKEYAKSNFSMDIQVWNSLETLEKYCLINKSVLGDDIKYALTNDGRKAAEKFIMDFKLQKNVINEANCDEEEDVMIDYSKAQVILLVDNRERYQSSNRTIIFEKLQKIHKVNCRLANLPVGDFLWIVKIGKDEYVLDYVVERKTFSDLAHSIMDKRYTDQKYKLKNCGLSRLFYLIENNQSSSNLVVPKQTVEKAIRQTQIRDGFLIQQTDSLEESLCWISMFTRQIKITENTKITPFAEFMQNNSSRGQTLQHQWGCMLKSISGVGQEAARNIVERWTTPMRFYDEINKNTDRISMLQGKEPQQSKTKGSKVKMNINIAQLIEVLFTFQEYPESNQQPPLLL